MLDPLEKLKAAYKASYPVKHVTLKISSENEQEGFALEPS